MKNSEYWKKRFIQLENAQHKKGMDAMKEIEEIYRRAQFEIECNIAKWYQRFADNNNITLAEARKLLSASDLAELKWDVNEYIRHGEQNAMTGQWMKELENASAKFHISKYEALKIKTQQSLEKLYSKQYKIIKDTMEDVYKSGYYHTAFELQKGFEIGWDISGIDQRTVERVLSKPWAPDGKNFSERIWGGKQKLVNELHNELSRGIMLGHDPQKTIDRIAKKVNTSKNNIGRLVMTEEAFFSSASQKDCFNDLGVEEYKILATLDSHTSDICKSLDGKHFPMKDYQTGVSAPPFHVWCRSTTVPYFDDEFGGIGSRAARDEKTGKTYYVPANINYQEWHKAFVEGDKSGYTEYLDYGLKHFRKEKVKDKADYLIRPNTSGQDITNERKIVDEAIAAVPKKVQDALANGTIIDIGKNGASQYDYNHDILYIAKGANKEAVIHEIGHMVENKLLEIEEVEKIKADFLKDVPAGDIVQDIFYDSDENPVGIFLLKNLNFVSEYQGRLYVDDWSEIYDESWNVRSEILQEFISEIFREYIENPERLRKDFPKFYELIRRIEE